jgi:PIN domain nuclease of toxin-antitoxin system
MAVSVISVWELALLFSRGKIQGSGTIEASIRELLDGVTTLPITPEIAALATQFQDDYPRDPADRLIGATARAEGITLVTRDERIRRSPIVRTVCGETVKLLRSLRDAGEGARATLDQPSRSIPAPDA